MIHLSGKDSFVIYQDSNSKKNKISIGKWKLLDINKDVNSPSFICNVFNNETYVLDSEIKNLHEEVSIKNPIFFKVTETNQIDYEDSVKKTINFCKSNTIEKCILSRVVKVNFDCNNYYEVYEELCKTYEDGFKYILNHPKYGLWIGISPETLIKGNIENGFYTHALAGSKSNSESFKWSEKEINEHRYVVDYIEKKILEDGNIINESNIHEKKAGKVVHLNKDFNFQLKVNYLSFINSLHPTPAVAGIPLEKSLDIIQKLELHKRDLYCGYIGVMDKNKCDIKVNLRCGRFIFEEAHIFVGGGITKQSNPLEEYKETEIKSQTLLSVIKKL